MRGSSSGTGEEARPRRAPAQAVSAEPDRVPWTPALIRLITGIVMALFVASLDTTIVSTALPTIAHEFGGFSLYAWVFSGYLITSTTSIPLWGRGSDLFGRRPVLIVGVLGFVVTSALCAVSASMLELVVFRSLQGLAAGAVVSTALTIASDVLPPVQRTRVQALISGISGAAAMLGPIVGAAFVSTLGWRWIFLVNLPIGAVSAFLLRGYREKVPEPHPGERIDPQGVALLTLGIAALLVGLGTGSTSAQPVAPALVLGAGLLAGSIAIELRSAFPTVPLRLLANPIIGPLILVGLFQGIVQYGVPAYGVLYVQDVLRGSALAAGAVVIPSTATMTVAQSVGTWVMLRVGYQKLVFGGGLFLVLGGLMLYAGPVSWGVAWVSLCSAVLGLGMGMFVPPVMITIQSAVGWKERGSATALNLLIRSLGGALGIAVMGIVVQRYVARGGGHSLRLALGPGLHQAFLIFVLAGVVISAAGLVIMLRGSRSQPSVAVA